MNYLDLLITGGIGFLLGGIFTYVKLAKFIRIATFIAYSKSGYEPEDAMHEALIYLKHIDTLSKAVLKNKEALKQFNQLERKVKRGS
jgi:hypothetical protein